MRVAKAVDELCPCRQWLRAGELGIQVGQHLEELLQLYEYLPDGVQHVLEIGTKHGGWLFMLASVLEPPARLCAVDPRHHPQFDLVLRELIALNYDVRRVQAKSCDALPAVQQWLADLPASRRFDTLTAPSPVEGQAGMAGHLDVLHIDGQHCPFSVVHQDWHMYSPLVRSGGIVAIHDIFHPQPAPGQLFQELQQTHKTHTCRVRWPAKGLGIGVVHIR